MTTLMLLSCLLAKPQVPDGYEMGAETEKGENKVSLCV